MELNEVLFIFYVNKLLIVIMTLSKSKEFL